MSTSAHRHAAGHARGHEVVFAESDAELVAVAASRLVEAHRNGAVLVVIATPEHRVALAAALAVAAVDVDLARREGTLVERDAAATLRELMAGGAFDAAAFDRVVGSLVRDAARRGAVYAFGEMVGLLWVQGRVVDALDLEVAWNGLLAETSSELLCGYPATVLVDHTATAAIETVCRLHSGVVVGEAFEQTWHFDSGPADARTARRVVTTALRARGVGGPALHDARIVLAELVANAVRHARTPFSVTLTVEHERIVLAVRDDSRDLPIVGPLRTSADSSGRGLHLVGVLARRWSVERRERGKVIRAELPR